MLSLAQVDRQISLYLATHGNHYDAYRLSTADWLKWWVLNYRVYKVPPEPEYADLAAPAACRRNDTCSRWRPSCRKR
jgi:hypothetical protein